MTERLQTISPVDGSVYVERPHASAQELETLIERATHAKALWANTPLSERIAKLGALVDAVVARSVQHAEELTWQMGRPITQTPGELKGFEDRARTMLRLAEGALADVVPSAIEGFERVVQRVPHGLVLVLAPWNYPWLTSVNAVIPALAAGNVVLLKHSEQTPLVAERFVEAGREAGLPEGVFQYVHMSHARTADVVGDGRVDFVAFTGSVEGGHAVRKAAVKRFIGMGLELGGKDPGYVRADADVQKAAEGLVDGAFFNSGQSCCGIERIYVHEQRYDAFIEAAVALTNAYKLGDPTSHDTNLGPVVRASSAATIQAQVDAALKAGARALIDAQSFAATSRGDVYMAPQILVDVDHSMTVMSEETFGPVVGVMKVKDDEHAVALMNDSRYGLTASLWTEDVEAARALAPRIETGTVFMNRCDYLDPELAWVGVKDSGFGCTLSRVGYEQMTRPKSLHFRLP